MKRFNVTKLPLVIMSLVLVGATLTGCGTTSKVATNAPAQPATAPATQTKELTIYAATGYDKAVATAFEAKTGIKVNMMDLSTGPLVAKVEAEKSNPQWDIVWFDGDSTMQGLDDEGMLLQNWTSQSVANYTDLGTSLIPADKAYYPTGTTAAAAIGVNTKLVTPDQYPKDWSDLLSPTLKDSVAMNDPSISGPTYPYVAGIINMMGDDQGKQYFQSLKTNGLKVFPKNGATIKALLAGQVKFATIQDSALVESEVKGDPIKVIYPSSGVFTLPSVVAIDKSSKNTEAAKQFVDYVLTVEGQTVMADVKNGGGDSYFNPIIKGVQPNQARQQTGIKWVKVDPVSAAKNINTLKKWFHDNIVQ